MELCSTRPHMPNPSVLCWHFSKIATSTKRAPDRLLLLRWQQQAEAGFNGVTCNRNTILQTPAGSETEQKKGPVTEVTVVVSLQLILVVYYEVPIRAFQCFFRALGHTWKYLHCFFGASPMAAFSGVCWLALARRQRFDLPCGACLAHPVPPASSSAAAAPTSSYSIGTKKLHFWPSNSTPLALFTLLLCIIHGRAPFPLDPLNKVKVVP